MEYFELFWAPGEITLVNTIREMKLTFLQPRRTTHTLPDPCQTLQKAYILVSWGHHLFGKVQQLE